MRLPDLDKPADEKKVFWVVIAVFTFCSLYPIWAVRFLPMQDYPQHLLQAHLLRERNNPAFDYRENFDYHFLPAPYKTFYMVTAFLAAFLPIETAGKIAISLYILAIALLIIKLMRRPDTDFVPWGLLLLFPFAFNQQYFLGNTNYLYSLPLLVFALLDGERTAEKPLGIWPFCRSLLWQFALLLTHPYTFLIYILLMSAAVLLPWRKHGFIRSLVILAPAVVIFVLWRLAAAGNGFPRSEPEWVKPFYFNLIFYGYIFSGMRWFDGADKIQMVLWAAMACLVIYTLYTDRAHIRTLSRNFLIFFAVTVIALCVFPFRWGPYTFVNFRIAAVSYFFLAVLVGELRFKGQLKTALTVLVALVLLNTVAGQIQVSRETEEIVPVIKTMPPNCRILPLIFDSGTPVFDQYIFEIHRHDYNYYHILKGGGLNPHLPSAKDAMFPVGFKTGVNLPAPPLYSPRLFKWEQYASAYNYLIVRSPPDDFVSYLMGKTELISRSGKWFLFKGGLTAAQNQAPKSFPKKR